MRVVPQLWWRSKTRSEPENRLCMDVAVAQAEVTWLTTALVDSMRRAEVAGTSVRQVSAELGKAQFDGAEALSSLVAADQSHVVLFREVTLVRRDAARLGRAFDKIQNGLVVG